MNLALSHPEDVKAAIRKRFGTLQKFELEHGLPLDSVSDLLRGKPSARVARAVEAVLTLESATKASNHSEQPDNNRRSRAAHRLNAKAA